MLERCFDIGYADDSILYRYPTKVECLVIVYNNKIV